MVVLTVLIFGLLFGSFLNVCIYRLPRHESIVWPGSHCPNCGAAIPFYHNIPVLSYLILKGRCSKCRQKISSRYLFVELLTALLTLLLYFQFGIQAEAVFYAVFAYFLIVIAFIDIQVQLIQNKVLLAWLIIGVILNAGFSIVPWKDALIGFVVGGVSIYLMALLGNSMFKKESMGMGDVKFAAVAGFFLGWKFVLIGLYFGFVLALVVFAVLYVSKRFGNLKYMPMGPFFAVSLLIFLFWGEQLIDLYLQLVL